MITEPEKTKKTWVNFPDCMLAVLHLGAQKWGNGKSLQRVFNINAVYVRAVGLNSYKSQKPIGNFRYIKIQHDSNSTLGAYSNKHGTANYYLLLYKHQWNTRWPFARKLDIFTFENSMLSSHVKISPLLWLHNKSRLSHQKTIKVKWFGISLVFI